MEAVSKSRQVVIWLRNYVVMVYVVLLQVQTVKCQLLPNGKDVFDKPTSQFCVELPGPLHSGKIIKIMGTFENSTLENPKTWMSVILRSRCLKEESPFRLSVRFDSKTVTRNSLKNGNWGEEETEGPFPFSLGAQFLLLTEVRPDGYTVKGNGVQLWTFEHRLPFDDVKYLEVAGVDLSVRKIELVDPNIKGQEHSQLVYPVPLTKPIIHPTTPFWGQFAEKVQAGKAIRIKGYFPNDLDRVSIDLYADRFNQITLLHLDIRFKFLTDVRRVVRNSYINGEWKTEERSGPFPFSVGQPFVLVILITPHSYNISVDDHEYWIYKHRMPYTELSSMRVTGPVNIWKIEYTDSSKTEQSSLILTEEPDLEESSSAASVYNIICILYSLPLYLFLKAM